MEFRNVTMLPRGLAAAVLATLPISAGIFINDFQEIVFAVIFFSNLVATGAIFLFDTNKKKEDLLKESIEEIEKEKDSTDSDSQKP